MHVTESSVTQASHLTISQIFLSAGAVSVSGAACKYEHPYVFFRHEIGVINI